MKKCIRCNEEKDEKNFYRNHDDCKPCWNTYCSERRRLKKEKDPNFLEKRRLYLQEWRAKNQDREKEYTKRSLEKNKDKIAQRRRTPEARIKMNILVKSWREKNKERFFETQKLRRQRNKQKINAVTLIGKHLRRGKIQRPNQCEKCMKECKPDGHHDDYNKPHDVRWLCKICHYHEHGKFLDG